MESSKKTTLEQNKTVGSAQKAADTHSPTAQDEPKSAIEQTTSEVAERAAKAYDQTKRVVSQAYEKTSQVATNTYDRAITYGKQQPGTLILIAFGAGIGVGLLLAGSFTSRSRVANLIEPVGNALTQMALEIFR